MAKLPQAVNNLIDSLEQLPGIGPKTAARLTFYLLAVPNGEVKNLAEAVAALKEETVVCQVCFNVADANPCLICSDKDRDPTLLMVVEKSLDVIALEKTGQYRGLYHVLGGALDPLNNIGPDEIRIKELLQRIKDQEPKIKEIILATNPTMEGEATAMYIKEKLKTQISPKDKPTGPARLKITSLARGLPRGADLDYADEATLGFALEGRRPV